MSTDETTARPHSEDNTDPAYAAWQQALARAQTEQEREAANSAYAWTLLSRHLNW